MEFSTTELVAYGDPLHYWFSGVVTAPNRPLPLPRAPAPPAESPFPLLMTIAPVVAALVMWVVTRSPFVLMFAFLGPVVAIASVGDARRKARVGSRRERARFERDLTSAREAIDLAHEQERHTLDIRYPSAQTIMEAPVHDPERWRISPSDALIVRIGLGSRDSGIVVEDAQDANSSVGQLLSDLQASSAVLTEAPITIDARLGLGVAGHHAGALSLVSSVVVQLANMLPPGRTTFRGNAATRAALGWLMLLPHWDDSEPSGGVHDEPENIVLEVWPSADGPPITIALAREVSALPRDCRVVVRATGAALLLLRHPTDRSHGAIRPDYITEIQAREVSKRLALAAQRESRRAGPPLPSRLEFQDLHHHPVAGRDSLSASVGMGSHGPISLDLVADGPHAVVGGTTGSGKSELLLTWILAIAAAHNPDAVNFLLIDFKGGASFSSVKDLAHTVGVLTDLDEPAARRAILSLTAELHRRERILAEEGARSIIDLPPTVPLARLVIVVDEFATLANQLPELHELFSDLAARGRSLGIHVVLCTQRPAGSVRDSVFANCALRISLRVHSAADSSAVVGVGDAAQLPSNAIGRAILLRGDGRPEQIQLAISSDADAAAIRVHHDGRVWCPHRPWLDPLPSVIPPVPRAGVDRSGIPFGVMDVPESQSREFAMYDPDAHGNLLVLGGHRSGKSGTLAVLCHFASKSVRVPAGVEGAWDTVSSVLSQVRTRTGPALVVFDDVDSVLSRFPIDYESAFLERLVALAREGPRAGTRLAVSSASVKGRLQVLESLVDSTLILRLPNRQDHVMAGGIPADFVAVRDPGGGSWRGRQVQVFALGPDQKLSQKDKDGEGVSVLNPAQPLPPVGQLAVVSSRPAALRDRLKQWGAVTLLSPHHDAARDAHELTVGDGITPPAILLGDPEGWQAAWSLLSAIRSRATLIFHDCPVSDFRAITRLRELPPPIDSPDTTAVALGPDGRMFRVRLPSSELHT